MGPRYIRDFFWSLVRRPTLNFTHFHFFFRTNGKLVIEYHLVKGIQNSWFEESHPFQMGDDEDNEELKMWWHRLKLFSSNNGPEEKTYVEASLKAVDLNLFKPWPPLVEWGQNRGCNKISHGDIGEKKQNSGALIYHILICKHPHVM